ncbi:MAG: DUF2812 domain-containing protein [Coriobacteriales bacterium]|jgi:hypothetical protein|nr:DUF2812 domain-containing protein [Coriobacteriales bacterium]
MRKFRLFVDFDKEERYLKDMAKKGYRLKKHAFLSFYQFHLQLWLISFGGFCLLVYTVHFK